MGRASKDTRYRVRKLYLPHHLNEHLNVLSRASGELYSRTLVSYWRVLRKKGLFLSCNALERLHVSDQLHAHSSDAVTQAFYAGIKSANARKRNGGDAKYPRKRRKYFKLTWMSAAITVKNGVLKLSNGRGNLSLEIPWSFGIPKQVEIGWKETGGYELRTLYVTQPESQALGDQVAGVDQGEIRTGSAFDGQDVITYNGRLVRSKNHYRNKRTARLNARIDRKKKGSNRRKRLIHAKRRMNARIKNQTRDILRKQAGHLVSTLHQRGVQTVAVGDITNIRDDIAYGKQVNQKLHQWAFSFYRSAVTNAARKLGLTVELVDEAYTSQTCPNCPNRYKPRGRTYTCKACGYQGDRDGVGAMNMRKKYLGTNSPVLGGMAPPTRGVRYHAHLACRTPLSVKPPRVVRIPDL